MFKGLLDSRVTLHVVFTSPREKHIEMTTDIIALLKYASPSPSPVQDVFELLALLRELRDVSMNLPRRASKTSSHCPQPTTLSRAQVFNSFHCSSSGLS